MPACSFLHSPVSMLLCVEPNSNQPIPWLSKPQDSDWLTEWSPGSLSLLVKCFQRLTPWNLSSLFSLPFHVSSISANRNHICFLRIHCWHSVFAFCNALSGLVKFLHIIQALSYPSFLLNWSPLLPLSVNFSLLIFLTFHLLQIITLSPLIPRVRLCLFINFISLQHVA